MTTEISVMYGSEKVKVFHKISFILIFTADNEVSVCKDLCSGFVIS